MSNPISKEFNFWGLLKFTFPTIVMTVFLSMYTIVDGVFVARFVGTDAMSAINIVLPYINMTVGVGVMFASGGSAIVAKKLGEGKDEEARSNFTVIILAALGVGAVISVLSFFFIESLLKGLGATALLYPYCYAYGLIVVLTVPISVLKMVFDFFLVTAGKPKLGLFCAVAGGVTNMVLDYIFIVPLQWGISGAAAATALGEFVSMLVGLIFFLNKKNHLHFGKPKAKAALILSACGNGSSEMVSNLSIGITTFLFNFFMLKLRGEDGVAAITIICYLQFMLISIYLGFTNGVSPVISYNYGQGNTKQLRNIVGYCLRFLLFASLFTFIICTVEAGNLIAIFTDRDSHVFSLALTGLRLFSVSFLFVGFNIFTSGMFTAFSNGRVSAIVSFVKNLGLVVGGILILPVFLEINGIWLAIPAAEAVCIFISAYFIKRYRNVYGYGKLDMSEGGELQ